MDTSVRIHCGSQETGDSLKQKLWLRALGLPVQRHTVTDFCVS